VSRIVAGTAGGRRLAVPPGRATRPTSDRTREGLFSSLETLLDLDGARVLDLYAGSGAVGLEALSRGAAAATLVEADPKALKTLRENVVALGLPGATVRPEKVERFAAGPSSEANDLVFLDPPYALAVAELHAVLADLGHNGHLVPNAIVVVERSSRDPEWVWPTTLAPLRFRRYGEGTLWYGRRS
jgi:16S rRNA (guanine966-N2)-methyltransferase